MLTLFELFGAVFLFIWCVNAVPTPLFLAIHPCWTVRVIMIVKHFYTYKSDCTGVTSSDQVYHRPMGKGK